MVTPGIRPLMSLVSFVTVKAPGPLPTVIWALAADVTVVSLAYFGKGVGGDIDRVVRTG